MMIFMASRFLFAVIAVYLVLTLVKGVLRALQTSIRPRQASAPPQSRPPQEVYRDVQDAKFTDVSGGDVEQPRK